MLGPKYQVLRYSNCVPLPAGCQKNVEDWQRILQVRSLVMSPAEDVKAWLKYASLCRKSGRVVSILSILIK